MSAVDSQRRILRVLWNTCNSIFELQPEETAPQRDTHALTRSDLEITDENLRLHNSRSIDTTTIETVLVDHRSRRLARFVPSIQETGSTPSRFLDIYRQGPEKPTTCVGRSCSRRLWRRWCGVGPYTVDDVTVVTSHGNGNPRTT